MSLLLFGTRGYLGQHFLRQFPDAVTSDVDIADPAAVGTELDRIRPDAVINAVGRTGTPNVDWCEDHKEETFRSNVLGPLVLREECAKRAIHWLHLSSGCVYSGDNGGRGYTEEDPPNFQGSFYSRTKQWAETMLREFAEPREGSGGILILRLRMPFEPSLHPKSLLTKVSRFARVIDVPNSLTYVPDLLAVASTLMRKRATGVWNVVNPGPISLYSIAGLYGQIVDPSHRTEPMTAGQAAAFSRAPRSNCVLSTKKLEREGIVLPSAEQRVREVCIAMAKEKAAAGVW